MAINVIKTYPNSGVLCSEITLTVRINYDEPFVAPTEWEHDNILRTLVDDDLHVRTNIESYEINCTAHVPWVELRPITYCIGHDTSPITTTPGDETDYRNWCRTSWRDPSQSSFFRWILRNKHGIGIVKPLPR